MVFLRRKSRTATLPRETLVSVPSQRSVIFHLVPRTVADELRPRVRKRPRVFARSRRILREAEAWRRGPCALQELEAGALQAHSVRPLALGLRDWSTWKGPS